ncbi:MAG: MarR family transcriptional regulator [Chloroflexota bacterium]|nr:MarR family transcriptional regulator [Chloroflexota bacterium]
MYDYELTDARFTCFFLLGQAWPSILRVVEKEVAKTGVSYEKLKALWICEGHPGPVTPAELSRLLYRKSHSVAGLLDRMERDGLVTREPKRKGHPFTEIRATEKGRELVRPGQSLVISLVGEMMSALTEDEQRQLVVLLRKLRDEALNKLRIEAKPWPGSGWRSADGGSVCQSVREEAAV